MKNAEILAYESYKTEFFLAMLPNLLHHRLKDCHGYSITYS